MGAVKAIAHPLEKAASRPNWLPAGKTAAICLSIDDVHPGTSLDTYEAGGDLGAGALGRLIRLQQRHPALKATLCVTPNWRLDSLVPDAGVLRYVPWVKRYLHWTRLQPMDRFRLDRHPGLVNFLNGIERCEVVPHGLSHAHVGARFAVEFQGESEQQCIASVQQGMEIFEAAKLKFVRGYVPPGWDAPPSLISALTRLNFHFLGSSRDVETPIAADAVTAMSGLRGASLIYPQFVGEGKLVHVTSNFQATSSFDRAERILDLGGVLLIKAHIFKSGGRHVMLDGLDDLYCNYLDLLFTYLTKRFGDRLWWAHLSEVAARKRASG